MQKEKLVIFGNGSMAKTIYSYLRESFDVSGFCVDSNFVKDNEFCDLPLVSFEEVEKYFPPQKYKMIIAVGFIKMNGLRKERSKQAIKKGYVLASYIDKTVKIHYDVEIGKNSVILDYVTIHAGTKIKDGTFISSNVNIGHDCTIGEYNWINSGVSVSGCVNIGEECFWGVNACCGNNISIGKKNYISANTLISKNTADNEVYISPSGEKFRLKSEDFLKFLG